MAISDEAYAALEDIVGKRNVSRNPAVMDSYAFQWLAELVRPELSHFMPRPVAVVMPGSTEEVQAIVKLANKYKIKVKPHSTGWYHWAAPMYDDKDTMQLDMRRMNAIEIDEKNGIAIVEPYVIHAQLHAEAIKRGWTCTIIGAGCSCSVVAAACAFAGMGPGGFWMGGHSENLLGMEWVTPNGDIVRSGSFGSGAGHVSSEGPGPSVRGIMRGSIGQRGGLGVFTKCSIKLAHWPGRTDWPVTGTVPAYRLPVDENFRVYTVAMPSWDAWADAYHKIYDNELGFIFHRQFNLAGADLAPAFWLMYTDPTKKLSDVPAMVEDPEIAALTEQMRISFQIVLAGRSVADIELQDQVLDDILAETGCWRVERYCENDMAEFTNLYLNRLGHKHINFVWVGGYIGSWMQIGPPDWVKGYIPTAIAGLARDAAGGDLVQCGGDAMMGPGSSYPGGGGVGLEQFVSYDPNDEASIRAGIKHMEDAITDAVAIGYPPGKEAMYLEMGHSDDRTFKKWAAAKQPFTFIFQRKIKEHFDPNDIGDRMYNYIPEEYEPTK
jgi:glycolate oxidase